MDDMPNDNKIAPESQDKTLDGQKIRYFHFDTIDSTNQWGKEHPDNWETDGLTVITAHEQTEGRGRFHRRWESPPGVNLYATFCFLADKHRFPVEQVPLILAISAAQVMEGHAFSPKIKWPNDLMLEGKKVGGILCETIEHHGERGVICGIGLNINMTLEMANTIDQPVTSLFLAGGKKYQVKDLLDHLVRQFVSNRLFWLKDGFAPFHNDYVERSYFKTGDKLTLHNWNKVVEGQFEGYDSMGGLMLLDHSGSANSYSSGEVIHCR